MAGGDAGQGGGFSGGAAGADGSVGKSEGSNSLCLVSSRLIGSRACTKTPAKTIPLAIIALRRYFRRTSMETGSGGAVNKAPPGPVRYWPLSVRNGPSADGIVVNER